MGKVINGHGPIARLKVFLPCSLVAI